MKEPHFRTDLYRGTASYYDRYRPPYPPALFEDLRVRVPVSGSGRLLDLACGTGQITFPLAGDFKDVLAVDQEEESVAFGREKAQGNGARNVVWLVGRAEDLQIDGIDANFELVAIGNAFQRLRRKAVAERVMSWLAPSGCVALLWGGIPWQGELRWQKVMSETFLSWMDKAGATDRVPRVPSDWKEAIDGGSHQRVLEQAGLSFVGSFEFWSEYEWTVESLTGYVYSTSFLNPIALGDHMEEFERDLRTKLIVCEPGGVFHQTISFSYDLARRAG